MPCCIESMEGRSLFSGALDPPFGVAGVTRLATNSTYNFYIPLAIGDGRTFVFDSINRTIRRLGLDGKIDTDFGKAGTLSLATNASITVVLDTAARPDGGVIVETELNLGNSQFDSALIAYDRHGRIDSSFGGGDGVVKASELGLSHTQRYASQGSFAVANNHEIYWNILVPGSPGHGPGGKYLAMIDPSGTKVDEIHASFDSGKPSFDGRGGVMVWNERGVWRYDAHGRAITGYVRDGVAPLSKDGYVAHAVVAADGSVTAELIGMDETADLRNHCELVRLRPDGRHDKTFSGDGTTPLPLSFLEFTSDEPTMLLEPDGSVVVSGQYGFALGNFANQRNSLLKFTATGQPIKNAFAHGPNEIVQSTLGVAKDLQPITLAAGPRGTVLAVLQLEPFEGVSDAHPYIRLIEALTP